MTVEASDCFSEGKVVGGRRIKKEKKMKYYLKETAILHTGLMAKPKN